MGGGVMAETVTVPGAGPMKRQTIVVAGAVGAGILGYAWWKRHQASKSVTATENINDAVGAVAYTGSPNVAGATGDSSVNAGTLPRNQIATNADWTQAAITFLSQTGNFDPGALATALGKYINHDPGGLTDKEVSMVQAARGAFGDPPVGGPFPIIHAINVPVATPEPGQGPGAGPGASNNFPGTGEQQLPPFPGAVPHVWETQPGDTLLNLVPRLYATDTLAAEPDPTKNVNPPTEANRAHREAVAHAIYLSNMFILPSDINAPLPPGIFFTYY
jgi:hypothetical protein